MKRARDFFTAIDLWCNLYELYAQAISAVPPYPGCNKGCVELLDLDLSSLNSVRDFIDTFKSKQLHLDLLICNAGIMAPLECLRTKDGIETQFQVTHTL